MPILEVKNIRKNFGSTEVLKGIDFTLEKGEILAIIGSSGSGKTTLLRCLNYLETPDEGSISVNGEENFYIDGVEYYYDGDIEHFHVDGVKRITPEKKRERQLRFGLVFQSFNLFPQYSVIDNIMLASRLLKQDLIKQTYKDAKTDIKLQYKQDADKAAYKSALASAKARYNSDRAALKSVLPGEAEALLEKVGLSAKADAYPCELSGGQQQRVAIARALAMTPDILCFDEPTSALDPELTGEVLNVIKGLKTSDSTMIVVTHEMGFAAEVADKVIFMADGVIVECGTPEELFRNPRSAALRSFLAKTAFAGSTDE